MNIFVAGSTGVLGRRIVVLLVSQGHKVTALTRREDRVGLLSSLGAHPVVADALDPDSLGLAVRQNPPDVVLHMLTDLAVGTSASNAALRSRGTRNPIDAARAAGTSRVVSESIAWAYAAGRKPADEGIPLDLAAAEPRQTTVRGVAALEQATRKAAEWVVLRYGMLYGPGTWYEPRGSKAAEARAGRLAMEDDVTSFVHVDDAAEAAVQALNWPSGLVNICDDEPAAGPGVDAVLLPGRRGTRVGRDRREAREPWARGADNHHARTELGWSPRYPSWRQGFQAMSG